VAMLSLFYKRRRAAHDAMRHVGKREQLHDTKRT
jgi:hypothetical protein